MKHRELRSGILTLECDECGHKWEERTRDADSMSSIYCPNWPECDGHGDKIDFKQDPEWREK